MAIYAGPPATPQYAAGREDSKDKSPRFAGDQFLREFGFVIHSRAPDGPAVWRRVRDGRLLSDEDARAAALAERDRQLRELEDKK